jgi:nucleoside-diphosphate-sugar epimerase
LGASPPVSLLEFVKTLLEVSDGGGGYEMVPFPAERKRIDIGDFYNDFGKIRQELGWEPQVSLREGLARTVDYYRRNIDHYLD